MTQITLEYDDRLRDTYPVFAGCDEVGRGCLAGPVVAAAVILPPNLDIANVMDSKKIKKTDMEQIARTIYALALDVQIGVIDAPEVDRLNVLEADKAAMRQAITKLTTIPDMILIDGNDTQLLGTDYTELTIVKGDDRSLTMGAASIVAKYARDMLMKQYNEQYPGYGFDTNAGYGTPQHKRALEGLGYTPIHRLSFEPIKSNVDIWPLNMGEE